MRNELTEALLIVQTVVICLALFVTTAQEQTRKEEIYELESELQSTKAELTRMHKELRNNDNIVLKLLEKEW